jgi:NADPH:quinone reductase-like Zn-dependent oxidoreductase
VCSTAKLELVRALGAEQAIDYTQHDFTEGAPDFDLIVDTAGRRPLSQLRRRLRTDGALVIVGGEGGGTWLGGFERNLFAPLRALGSKQKLIGLVFEERREDLLTLKQLIESGQMRPIIDRAYPLAQAPDAIRQLAAGHTRGKLVVRVS